MRAARTSAARRLSTAVKVCPETGLPELNTARRLEQIGPMMASGLRRRGYYISKSFLGAEDSWRALRADAERMQGLGRFVPSMSVGGDGVAFAKPGVESCELEAADFEAAPHLLTYTRDVVLTLPTLLNSLLFDGQPCISTSAYGTKLARTTPCASYPKHVDNACVCDSRGLPHDLRWITCVYYLNSPDCRGGELRLWLETDADDARGRPFDLYPAADTLIVFFADRLVHEVLPTAPDSEDRYALTLWLVADQASGVTTSRSASELVSDRIAPATLCAADRGGTMSREAHFGKNGR